MSSRQYTVTVKVKGDDAFRKIAALEGGGGRGGGGTSASAAGSGGALGKIANLNAGMLLKLTGIGVSLGTIAALTIKSSGILQQSLKLAETSMLLIFRPIGDFIGLALRPLVLSWFVTALPAYREWIKFSREWGPKVGEALATFFGGRALEPVLGPTPEKSLDIQAAELFDQFVKELGVAWTSFLTRLGGELFAIPSKIGGFFTELGEKIWDFLVDIPPFLGKLFTDFGTNVWNWLVNIPQFIGGLFTDFGQMLWNGILGVPGIIVDVFTGLASNLASALAGIPAAIADAIMAAIRAATGGIFGAGSTIAGGSSLPAGSGTPTTSRQRTTMQAVADTL